MCFDVMCSLHHLGICEIDTRLARVGKLPCYLALRRVANNNHILFVNSHIFYFKEHCLNTISNSHVLLIVIFCCLFFNEHWHNTCTISKSPFFLIKLKPFDFVRCLFSTCISQPNLIFCHLNCLNNIAF